MVPRMPQAFMLHQVGGGNLAVVHEPAQGRRDGEGVVEGAERVLLDVETAVGHPLAHLVGKTGA